MKKIFLLYVLAIVVFQTAEAQEYSWKDISANLPGTPDLSNVYFVSDNEGWITSSSQPEIYHTTDGGQTFEVQTTEFYTEAIHMLNENEGYAGRGSGHVYRTTDGGKNWIAIGSMGTTLTDITFPPTGGRGYACGLNGNIYSVESKGVKRMTSGVHSTQNSISFPINSEEGWVCGGSIIRHFFNDVWNGDKDYPSGGYNGIYMVDTLNGWAVGDKGIIIHTEDGHNLYKQTNPDPDGHTFFDVYFLNNKEGWAVGSGCSPKS